MKKLLLGTAAVAFGLTAVAGAAHAQVKLNVGGHTKLYGSWLDQDDANTGPGGADDVRSFDILRETELHFTGETTLDNGLTVGAHIEIDVDGTDSSLGGADAEEAYAYFSGAWGRVNLGREDGATYLLQVAAPSADSNVDGIRQWISGTNYTAFAASAGAALDGFGLNEIFSTGININNAVIFDANGNGVGPAAGNNDGAVDVLVNAAGFTGVTNTLNSRFDYDHAVTGYSDKLTYMTPVFNGFQAGVSYTPDVGASRDRGHAVDNNTGDWGSSWEVGARYEGQFDQVGITLGGGWSRVERENDGQVVFYRSVSAGAGFTAGTDPVIAVTDDRKAWNVGINLNWSAFGLGGAFMRDDNGVSGDNLETDTWVVGLDYTTGPFKLGASYYDSQTDVAGAELDVDRWTAGVVYTYGPGMTFRGSVSWIDHEENLGFAATSADSTNVLLGTQINF